MILVWSDAVAGVHLYRRGEDSYWVRHVGEIDDRYYEVVLAGRPERLLIRRHQLRALAALIAAEIPE
jgi:hypothetical protein